MKLVKQDGSLIANEFTCNEKQEKYIITASNSTYQSVWNTEDTVKRLSDNKKMNLTREQISKRFTNVQT